MKKRCRNPNDRHYGAKGITVCADWMDFEAFRHWALSHGYDEHLTIERIDASKGYNPENCEWITFQENRNRMLRQRNNFPFSKRDPFGIPAYLPIEALWGTA